MGFILLSVILSLCRKWTTAQNIARTDDKRHIVSVTESVWTLFFDTSCSIYGACWYQVKVADDKKTECLG